MDLRDVIYDENGVDALLNSLKEIPDFADTECKIQSLIALGNLGMSGKHFQYELFFIFFFIEDTRRHLSQNKDLIDLLLKYANSESSTELR